MNSTKNYDFGVFIGRFQPFHNGHKFIVEMALRKCKKLIIFFGSAGAEITDKNSWTYEERVSFMESSLSEEQFTRITPIPLPDYKTDEEWVSNINKSVNRLAKNNKVVLVGHYKDDSSYYLKLFPDWSLLQFPKYKSIDATYIRSVLQSKANYERKKLLLAELLPHKVLQDPILFKLR